MGFPKGYREGQGPRTEAGPSSVLRSRRPAESSRSGVGGAQGALSTRVTGVRCGGCSRGTLAAGLGSVEWLALGEGQAKPGVRGDSRDCSHVFPPKEYGTWWWLG